MTCRPWSQDESVTKLPSGTILLPLTTEETQAAVDGLERNLTALWKEEYVPFACLDSLTALVRNFEISVDDDLHFVVGVCVLKWLTRIQAIEACANGFLGVELLAVKISLARTIAHRSINVVKLFHQRAASILTMKRCRPSTHYHLR